MSIPSRVRELERRVGEPGKTVYIPFMFDRGASDAVKEAKRAEAVRLFEEEHACEVNLDCVSFVEIEIWPGRNLDV
jgi:hypothetical protein